MTVTHLNDYSLDYGWEKWETFICYSIFNIQYSDVDKTVSS